MKTQRSFTCLIGLIAVSILVALPADSSAQQRPKGNYTYLNPFAHKPATEEAHWDYAQSLLQNEKVGAARKQFEIFVKRWPSSERAAVAQKSVGDLYRLQGKSKKAFDAYETLIEKFYTDISDYEQVLEKQLSIADAEVNRRRMAWLFGGYTAPRRAVPYFESIIRNAPQWERTPELQYRIGKAYQKDNDHELAVSAFTTVAFRYPDSDVAEQAAFGKIESLRKLVRKTPYSSELRNQAAIAVSLFTSLYPESEHLGEAKAFGQALRNASARSLYETATYYDRESDATHNAAARIYYEKVINQYEGTDYAELAADRLRVLIPSAATAGAETVRPEIVPVPSEPVDAGADEAVADAGAEEAVAESVVADAGAEEAVADSETESVVADAEAEEVAPIGPIVNVDVAPLPDRLSDDPEAIEVTADRMEYEGDVLTAEGTVAFQQTGFSLRADHVTVNQTTGDVTANGDVVVIRDNMLWEGQDLLYNFKTRAGTFGTSSIYFDPAYITAERIDRISDKEFLMSNARITTCSGENPIVYIKAKELHVIEDEDEVTGTLIAAKSVTFYVGNVPVFYMPVWRRHLGYRVFTYTLGYGSKLGGFFMGRMALRPTEWLNTSTHLDFYTSRGVGLGQDFFWEFKEEVQEAGTTNTVLTTNGVGSIETYYINDSSPYENVDTPAEEALVDSSRYRVKIGHEYDLDEETYFITKINVVSDPYVIEDFFREEFRHNANPENYAVLQHANDTYATSLRIDKRLNDFYTKVDRLPELDFDWYRAQINDESPFFVESESSLAFLEKLHGELDRVPEGTNSVASTNLTLAPKMPDYSSARLDTYNRIYLPLRINEYYNVIPRVAYRGTWYSDTASSGDNLRHIVEFGTLASTKTYKTLTEQSGVYGDGLRHIIEPYADYNFRTVSIDPLKLHQFDEIDGLDDENRIRFGVRNLLQTHSGTNRISNVLDADVFTSIRLDPQGDENVFGTLGADLELRLTDKFSLSSDLEFDWYESEFKDFNARARYRAEDMSEFSLSYRYLNGSRSLFTPSVHLFPHGDWSYIFYAQYDSTYSEWQERRFIVQHKFDCLSMGVGVEIDEDAEATFWLQVWLNAYPSVGFGQR